MDTRGGQPLPKLFWRRFRCAGCGRLFELPLNDASLPPHPNRSTGGGACDGGDAIPA